MTADGPLPAKIEAEDLNPSISFQPLRLFEDIESDELVDTFVSNHRTFLLYEPHKGKARAGIIDKEISIIPPEVVNGWTIVGATWSQRRPVAWLEDAPHAPIPPDDPKKETERERIVRLATEARISRVKSLEQQYEQVTWNLLLLAVKQTGKKHDVAVHCTDGTIRKAIAAFLETGAYGDLYRRRRLAGRLPKKRLEAVCLAGDARQASLTGLHRETVTRASKKSLHGLRLQNALDPFADQTFRLDSAVSIAPDRTPSFLGVALKSNQVWSSRGKQLADYADQLTRFFDLVHADERRKSTSQPLGMEQPGLSILADDLASDELEQVNEAMDVSFRPLVSLIEEDDEESDAMRALREREQEWFDGGTIIFEETKAKDRTVTFTVTRNGNLLLRQTIEPVREDQVIKMEMRNEELLVEPQHPDVELFAELCRGDNLTQRFAIWYSSGHVVAGGTLARLKYQDVLFRDGWKWVSYSVGGTKYDVTAEKPTRPDKNGKSGVADLDRIGEDKSIFCYLLRAAPELIQHEEQDGDLWKICDDGGGEIADFIYFAPKTRKLWLIHAKGAHVELSKDDREAADAEKRFQKKLKNRRISVSAYEQVVGQATKNMAYLDAATLAIELKKRRPKHIWKNGERESWANLATVVETELLKKPFLYQRALVIAQPHVLASAWKKAKLGSAKDGAKANGTKAYRLLSTLLADAQIAAQKQGMEFHVLGQLD